MTVAAAELLAYLVVADRQIHRAELAELELFLSRHSLESSRATVMAVLSDSDEKTPLGQVWEDLATRDVADINALLEAALTIASADCHQDPSEMPILTRLFDLAKVPLSQRSDRIEGALTIALSRKRERDARDRTISRSARFRLRLLSALSPKNRRAHLRRQASRLELTGPSYRKAILEGSEIAEADASAAAGAVESVKRAGEEARHRLGTLASSGMGHSSEAADTNEHLRQLVQFLDEELAEHLESIETMLNKKRRASHFFTIAFLGRTKSGKSTLHSLLTGSGQDFIGIGQQRTTRYNRVYEWECLRILDTPGIGAAQTGGRSDEEIATEVIDEADLVCCLVANDGVQETEFQFLKGLQAAGKPVLVVLNVKSNLVQGFMLRTFIRQPLGWFESTGPDRVQGYVDRIQQKVRDSGSEPVPIVPVHLLAAQRSCDVKLAGSDRRALLEGARIEELYAFFRQSVLHEGTIRRTKNLVDGTRLALFRIKVPLELRIQETSDLVRLLAEKRKNLGQRSETVVRRSTETLKRVLSAQFTDWKSRVVDFAKAHYSEKEQVAETAWKEYLDKTIKVESTVHDIVNAELKKVRDDLKDDLEDLADDLSFAFKNSSTFSYKRGGTFNTRRAFSVGSLLLGITSTVILFLEASNPVGWVFAIGSVIVGLLSNLFKSKETKVAEAQEKLRTALVKNLDQIEKHNLDSAISQAARAIRTWHEDVCLKLLEIEKVNSDLASIASSVAGMCDREAAKLDDLYGRRLWARVSTATEQYRSAARVENTLEIRIAGEVAPHWGDSLSSVLQEPIRFVSTEGVNDNAKF